MSLFRLLNYARQLIYLIHILWDSSNVQYHLTFLHFSFRSRLKLFGCSSRQNRQARIFLHTMTLTKNNRPIPVIQISVHALRIFHF